MPNNIEITSLQMESTHLNMKWVLFLLGFFSISLHSMNMFIIPIWALHLNTSPLMIGIVVAAGSFLPVFFSISSGALVDQLGSKKILVWCSISNGCLALAIFIFPSIYVLIFIQLLYGQFQAIIWIAAQSYVARLSKATKQVDFTRQFSIASNIGGFVGPLLLGFIWDFVAIWAAFATISGFAVILCIVSLYLSEKPREIAAEMTFQQPNNRLFQYLPHWKDYKKAVSLLVVPAVMVVVVGTFLRLAGFSIRNSFYVVYLEDISFTAVTISVLYSFLSLVGIFSPMFMKGLTRWFREEVLLFIVLAMGILPLTLTPLFENFWQFLSLAFISGFGFGLTLPLLITILAKAVSPEVQGLSIGIRETSNRVASVVVPFFFGLLAEGIGIQLSFYAVGGGLLVFMFATAYPLLRKIWSAPRNEKFDM